MNKERAGAALKAAFPHTIPVLAGFSFLGLVFGMLMASKGYHPCWSLFMSAAAFCGSMQFVAVTLLVSAAPPLEALLLSFLVNARHIFYGISLLTKYKGMGKVKFFLIYLLCDETYSIVSGVKPPEGVSGKWFYFWISLLDYCYWVMASFAGGLLGNLIHINMEGFDFALTALFVVIFLNQIKEEEKRLPAFLGVAGTVAMLLLFGSDSFIIPAMTLIAVMLTILRRPLERKEA